MQLLQLVKSQQSRIDIEALEKLKLTECPLYSVRESVKLKRFSV